MRLVHWSYRVVTEVKGKHQDKRRGGGAKPKGFWLSDESRGAYGWRAWCRSENFRSYGFRYEHEVKLSPKAKILYLRTAKDIDEFGDKYKADTDLNRSMNKYDSIYDIDWSRVAKKYHGIIITPYIWEQRAGRHGWYYGWDCASGCIWNKRAIESIAMVKERKVPHWPNHRERARKRKRDMQEIRDMVEQLRSAKKELING